MERDILQRRVVEVEDAACLLTWDFSLKIPKAEEATDESGHTHVCINDSISYFNCSA